MGAIVAPVGISLRLSFSLTLAIGTPHSGRVTIANMVSESAVGSNSKSMGAIVAPLGISLTLAIVTPHSGRVAIANMVSESTVGSNSKSVGAIVAPVGISLGLGFRLCSHKGKQGENYEHLHLECRMTQASLPH